MPESNPSEIDLRYIETWLREAGEIAMKGQYSLKAISKDDGSLVTDIDHRIENLLYDRISEHYPDHQILAEEGRSQRNNSEYLWTVDPIDGTRAYASGLPVWGISIGILQHGSPYAGMFFMPATQELYSGIDGRAFFNSRLISPPAVVDIQNTLAFIAVPSNAHRQFEISFRRLRSLGSTTAHLAYVARGAALAALTRPLYIWDIAPVMPLLKATGIALRSLSGAEPDWNRLLHASPSREPLIAAPVSVIESIRGLIRNKSNT